MRLWPLVTVSGDDRWLGMGSASVDFAIAEEYFIVAALTQRHSQQCIGHITTASLRGSGSQTYSWSRFCTANQWQATTSFPNFF